MATRADVCSLLTRRDSSLWTLPTVCFFNLSEFCHQLHCLGGDLGAIRGVELVELATAMGPTAGQYHTLIAAVGSGHLVVGTTAVDLKQNNGAKKLKTHEKVIMIAISRGTHKY